MPRFATISCLLLGLPAIQAIYAQSAAPATPATNASQTSSTLPTGVELEIGMGSRIGGPQISNYQSNNGVLSLTNLGRATPQLMTGLGFAFCSFDPSQTPAPTPSPFCKNTFSSRLGVFVTAQFGSGSNQTISGYSIGMTIGLGKYLRGLVGFSETPVSQISPGFATAASQYVSKNAALFPGIDPSDLASNAYGAFDGIQTTSTAPAAGSAATSTIYYPGAVTETHYRGGFLIGVSLPINIYNIFKGSSTGSSQ